MLSNKITRPLVMVIGPTAVGKTQFSISLAEIVHGEIISADSRQFYRGMDIGTAKPEPQDLERVPHHLINIADPDEIIDLSRFHKLLDEAVDSIYAREHLPIMVGGTGQYVRSILEGWDIPSQPADPEMRIVIQKWAEQLGAFDLHNKLQQIDPEAAGFIQPQNVRRVIRALEVIFSTGRKFSDQRQTHVPKYQVLMIGLLRERKELYSRIDERIDAMIQLGLQEEVRCLLQQGYSPALPAMSAIGYKEMVDVLQSRLPLNEAVVIMKRRTREFVRRQANWFKPSDPQIHWLSLDENLMSNAVKLTEQFLSAKSHE